MSYAYRNNTLGKLNRALERKMRDEAPNPTIGRTITQEDLMTIDARIRDLLGENTERPWHEANAQARRELEQYKQVISQAINGTEG